MDKLIIDKNTLFKNSKHEEVSLNDVIERIKNFYSSSPHGEYRLSVGTDSMTHEDTKFVMAIVLHNVGKGGIYFYKIFHHARITNLHDKLYKETQLSLDAAEMLIGELLEIEENIFDKMRMSIHLDIGENGPTKSLIRELEGWVTAMGYDYAIKPDSYAASTIADLYSK